MYIRKFYAFSEDTELDPECDDGTSSISANI